MKADIFLSFPTFCLVKFDNKMFEYNDRINTVNKSTNLFSIRDEIRDESQ